MSSYLEERRAAKDREAAAYRVAFEGSVRTHEKLGKKGLEARVKVLADLASEANRRFFDKKKIGINGVCRIIDQAEQALDVVLGATSGKNLEDIKLAARKKKVPEFAKNPPVDEPERKSRARIRNAAEAFLTGSEGNYTWESPSDSVYCREVEKSIWKIQYALESLGKAKNMQDRFVWLGVMINAREELEEHDLGQRRMTVLEGISHRHRQELERSPNHFLQRTDAFWDELVKGKDSKGNKLSLFERTLGALKRRIYKAAAFKVEEKVIDFAVRRKQKAAERYFGFDQQAA